MEEQVWRAYTEKHRLLNRKYRTKHLLTWLCWCCYYSVTGTLVWLTCFERHINALIYFFVINTLLSLFVTVRHVAKLRYGKEKERRALVESAPLGRFQI